MDGERAFVCTEVRRTGVAETSNAKPSSDTRYRKYGPRPTQQIMIVACSWPEESDRPVAIISS